MKKFSLLAGLWMACLVISCKNATAPNAEKISELAGNPRSHVALLEQLKYQECEGEASIQNALEMGLQTLK